MAKCVICNRKLVKADNKVCPDCGAVVCTVNQAYITAPQFKKRTQVNMLFTQNRLFFKTYSVLGSMFGLIGALASEASSKTGCYNTADITSIEYPVVVPKLSKTAIVITFADGQKIEIGSVGSKKKTTATYEALKNAYSK